MPGIIIDEFSAKPAGFLARWRYTRVTVNTETHEVGALCVAGKECLNLDNLADYQKVSRRYSPTDFMTDFCDFVTFEKITLRAANIRPFAVSTEETNVAACGYNTPIPAPAVPPNPWGNVVYGAYKTYDFCDETGAYQYLVTIYKKNYSGAITAINQADPVPVSIRFNRENKFDPICGSEMTFGFMADEDFDLSEFQNDDEREYKAVVERNGELFFSGFIVPDLAEEPFDAFPYPVSLRVTDGLGLLKNQNYPVPVTGTLNIQQRFVEILAYAFSQTGILLDIYTVCNLYEQSMSNNANDDPLWQGKVNPLRMADDKGNITNCYDVLSKIATLFGAFICQSRGKWHFIRVNDLSAPIIRRRLYNYTALFLYSDQLDPIRTVGEGEEIIMINNNAKRYRTAAYKYVRATMKFGFLPSTVYNGDFEQWDGSNFTYWSMFGGLNFSRIQKILPGAGGAPVLIEDYALQFNERFDPNKWGQPAVLSVNVGDTLILTLNIGSLGYIDEFIFRIKIGEYWLKNSDALDIASQQQNGTSNVDNNGSYVWVKTGLATATFLSGAGTKDINNYQLQINIPEMPTFGEMQIQLCGFRQWNTTAQLLNGVLITKLVPTQAGYTPVTIDNVSAAITKNPNENTPDGTQFKSSQDKYYTLSKDVETVYGDNTSNSIFNNVANRRFEYDPLKNNLHSIFTADNSYSKLWYEYGSDSTKLPINAHLAKGILKAYQRTLSTIDADLQGDDIEIINLFNICETGKTFMPLAGEFDLIKNQLKNVTLVETFSKTVQTQDTAVTSTPALINSIIPQDTTVQGYLEDDYDRIFYPQFTDEFT